MSYNFSVMFEKIFLTHYSSSDGYYGLHKNLLSTLLEEKGTLQASTGDRNRFRRVPL